MRIIPATSLRSVISLAAVCVAFPTATRAQTPAGDTARDRTVRQAGAAAGAQSPPGPNDSLFRRAEQLVRDGHGEAGRALVDTVLAAARPGSPAYGQALYWRSALAADAAEAERGYRRVIVEYPASRWAGDAMLNLAQLELARGDQVQALGHLQRFEREYPGHESRARASFWLARLLFDRNSEPRACAALATARASSSPEDVELRNQIDYYGQRCMGVDTTMAAAATAAPRPVAAAAAAAAPATAPATAPTTAPPPSAPPPTPSSASTPERADGGNYTVQVAAYDTRTEAEALIAKLRARGYTARLASSARPFRVRIGRYDARADAVAAQKRLKAKGIEGFVTEVER
jgi:TolA-binding protein